MMHAPPGRKRFGGGESREEELRRWKRRLDPGGANVAQPLSVLVTSTLAGGHESKEEREMVSLPLLCQSLLDGWLRVKRLYVVVAFWPKIKPNRGQKNPPKVCSIHPHSMPQHGHGPWRRSLPGTDQGVVMVSGRASSASQSSKALARFAPVSRPTLAWAPKFASKNMSNDPALGCSSLLVGGGEGRLEY